MRYVMDVLAREKWNILYELDKKKTSLDPHYDHEEISSKAKANIEEINKAILILGKKKKSG